MSYDINTLTNKTLLLFHKNLIRIINPFLCINLLEGGGSP